MKCIDEYNYTYDKQIGVSSLIIFIIILVVGLICFPIYSNQVMHVAREDAVVTLQSVSSQNRTIIENELKEKQKNFYLLARRLEKEEKYDIQDILEELTLYVEMDSLFNMGIIDQNGIGYTTLGERLDLSRYDYFIDGMKGISTITNSQLSENKQELLNIFTTPIYKEGQVEMILTATYKSSDFSKLLNVTSFNGLGHSIAIDAEGGLITGGMDREGLSLDEEYDENKHREEIAKMVAGIIEEQGSQITNFEYDGKLYLAYYEPIGINDWNLVSYVPKEYLYKNINTIKDTFSKGYLVIYIACILFLVNLIREQIKYKQRMTQLVFWDELTGEKNSEYLKLYFKNMSEEEKKEKSLVVLDIDKFKSINIIYGSEAGDRVLKYIVSIFKELLPNDDLFRYQADIFVGIVHNRKEQEIIEKMNQIEARIKEDVEAGIIIPIEMSFGVCSLDEFSDFYSIYNNALIAKNEVKESINRNIKFFNEEDKNQLIENREIELDFLEALKNNEFEVWYQPKYNAKTEEIYGAEALVRWRKQNGHFVFPSKFIPVFEKTGQIIKLDEVVIEKVFHDIQEMKQLGLDIKPISVNLSRIQATNFGLIRKIKELVEVYRIDPSKISFEITESAMIDDIKSINYLVDQLHKIGFKVDVDDYGMGNSTLNSIFGSNFDTLKLDKSFVDHIGNPKMNAIIHSTIEMAHKLNMTIIAEGVETKQQVDFLVQNRCPIIQGYYYSKPLMKEDYLKLLRR